MSGRRAARLARRWRVVVFVAEPLYTIPITCCLDGQAHDVTDENVAAGHRTGEYQALCGYLVSAAPLVAPVGRRCASCAAVVRARRSAPTIGSVRRSRHRQPGWLWRLLRPGCSAGARWLSWPGRRSPTSGLRATSSYASNARPPCRRPTPNSAPVARCRRHPRSH